MLMKIINSRDNSLHDRRRLPFTESLQAEYPVKKLPPSHQLHHKEYLVVIFIDLGNQDLIY